MGRIRRFNREDVLAKAMPLFWRQGYAATSLHDIEAATGAHKSGLYAEFKDKEELFLAALAYYFETRGGGELLRAEPLGWDNVEAFLVGAPVLEEHRTGCFAVSSLRDLHTLSDAARDMSTTGREALKTLFRPNIAAVVPEGDVEPLCDMIATFFAGLCIETGLDEDRASVRRRVTMFMRALRAM